ncbi:hypothetical protein [Actinosynnema sp. NPDC023587]|uniref:hypothetical protein n=1 Tax=Actinosynnema sp. NPDC023587 TaxID=3154695 RepID=UPI0033E23AFD
MIRTGRRVLLVVGLVAVVGGCSVRVGGTPVAGPIPTTTTTAKDKSRATAVNLLGDLPTFDPCSLFDPADLKAYGTAALSPPESLDYCPATLTTPAGTELDVQVGSLDQLASESEVRADYRNYRGGLRIAYQPDDTYQCARRLVFADLVTLSITVSNYNTAKTTSSELCNPADALATAAADRVLAEDAGHRAYQARSIGKVDPCSIAARDTVAKVPGLLGAKARPYPAAHQCRWSRDGSVNPPRMRLTFTVGVPAEADGGNTTVEDVAGRRTAISRTAVTSLVLCVAETAHLPVGDGVSEIALVAVTLAPGSSVDLACTTAKAVAADVWPLLPR